MPEDNFCNKLVEKTDQFVAEPKHSTETSQALAVLHGRPDWVPADLAERVEVIDKMCEGIPEDVKRFVPLYPWVFVMVCRKAQKLGSIHLPDSQNKPVHEGIVLATWRDKMVERGTINKNGERLTRCEVLRSDMKLGDRVLFHHWAGQPVAGYAADRFRVVREELWSEGKEGGIFARIELDEDTQGALDLLLAEIDKRAPIEDAERTMLRAMIAERFCVVDREAGSVTLSGV